MCCMATENHHRKKWPAFLAFVFVALAPASAAIAQQTASVQTQKLPVTTTSPAAARYFENGMREYEMHRWNFALNDWEQAVKLDPHFALAHVWICMTTVDPAEEAAHRDRAKT